MEMLQFDPDSPGGGSGQGQDRPGWGPAHNTGPYWRAGMSSIFFFGPGYQANFIALFQKISPLAKSWAKVGKAKPAQDLRTKSFLQRTRGLPSQHFQGGKASESITDTGSPSQRPTQSPL